MENNEYNDLVKMYAEKKNISEPAAYLALKQKWIPRSQVFDLVDQNQNVQDVQTTPMTSDLLIEKTRAATEKARLEYEQKRLELLDKSEVREQRRLEMQEAKIASDEKIALQRLELEKSVAAQRADAENRRLAAKEDFDQKLLLIQANKTGSGDMFEQINQVNKLEQTFSDRMIARAEALGVDAATLKKITGSAKKEAFNFNKLLDLAAPFLENAQKQPKEIQNIPSGLEKQQTLQIPEQPRKENTISPEDEARIRNETQLVMEKQQLILEKHELKYQLAAARKERVELESRAIKLGLNFDHSLKNEEIFSLIEETEARIEPEKQYATSENIYKSEREKLISQALDQNIPFDEGISNSQLAQMIEEWQIERKKIINQVEPEPSSEIKKPKIKRQTRTKNKATKDLKKFSVSMDDENRTFIKDIDAKSFRSVVLKLAKELNGTAENPVRIRIKKIDDEQEKTYDTWCEKRNGKLLLKFKEIKEVKPDPEITSDLETIKETPGEIDHEVLEKQPEEIEEDQ